MHDFWLGFFVAFVVLTLLCVLGVCCLVMSARSGGAVQGCAGCDAMERDALIARICKERDELRKENEDLRRKVMAMKVEREIGKTAEPKNTYEELEHSWEKV